jgi:hypothetical protein
MPIPQQRSAWAAAGYALAAAACAILIPLRFLPADPWVEASRAIRAEARPGDLVVLYPAARLDRLRSFDGLWAVAADPTRLGELGAFRRTFWVGQTDAPRRTGFELRWTRRFGSVTVELMDRPLEAPRR